MQDNVTVLTLGPDRVHAPNTPNSKIVSVCYDKFRTVTTRKSTLDDMTPAVYEELRRLPRATTSPENAADTPCQPHSPLVYEAYLRLVGTAPPSTSPTERNSSRSRREHYDAPHSNQLRPLQIRGEAQQ